MKTLKTAVIGVGYLGHYHAEKFASLPGSELIAVCDIDQHRCQEIAHQHQVEAIFDYHHLADRVDAVSIAAPTPIHFEIAHFFLSQGIHVLLEKPIATTLNEAEQLIETAKKHQALLQIGHLERFNNAIKALDNVLFNPRFIESLRMAPFKLRGSDVNVILDLMIHDIDIIQSLVKSKIIDINANGASILSPYLDIANARIQFANGCVANVTASRVSIKPERKLHIFQHDCYMGLDLNHKKLSIHRKGQGEMFPGIPNITREKQRFDKGDPLKDQIAAFLDAIINNKPAVVSGEDGKEALETAIKITQIVHNTNKKYPVLEPSIS